MESLVVRFEEPLPAGEVPGFSAFGRWSGVHGGQIAVSEDRQSLRFFPERSLFPGEMVRATLDDGEETFTWSFWTPSASGSLDLLEVDRVRVRRDGEDWVQLYGAYAGDLDGDGDPDIWSVNEQTADVRLFINERGRLVGPTVVPVSGGSVPSTNEGADFDRDGDIDFVVGNQGNRNVSLLTLTADAGLIHSHNHEVGRSVRGLCVLDLDRDGWDDVVTASYTGRENGEIGTLLNDRTGSFNRGPTVSPDSRGVRTCASGDYDGDGGLDVYTGTFVGQELMVYRSAGAGELELAQRVPIGGSPWMIAVGDLNGDGHPDVASANRLEDNVGVILSREDGSLRPAVTYAVGEDPLAIDVGDIDGDGDLDVISSNYGTGDFTLYENTGDGRLANPQTYRASTAGSCAVIMDIDGDGDLDVVGIDEIDDIMIVLENR